MPLLGARRTRTPHSVSARILVLATLLAPALGLPLTARANPAVWVTPGGGPAWIPNELPVKPQRPQFGLLLGVRLTSRWGLEAHSTYIRSPSVTPGGPSYSLPHFEGNLTWFLTGDRFLSPYLTGGAGVMSFRPEGGGGTNRFEFGGGLGFRVLLGDAIAFRVEGRDLRYKVPLRTGGEAYRHHPEAFAGISFGLGGEPKDLDRDGVPDKVDRCARTPFGARVDGAGCPIDSDGDGVFDGIDACEGTPPGAGVDARGCSTDSDGDGVMDGVDGCPSTPAGALVDAAGCPRDSDEDKVLDGLDQCPGTQKGCIVNPNGCPPDSDQDGVCDGIDECPETPTTARVDRVGCPIIVSSRETELLETGMIRLQDINFDTGKSTIRPSSHDALDEVGNILARWPDLRIEIGGHTDSRGSTQRNLELSKDRAEAVLRYLLDNFPELNPDQFTAAGYGAARPVSDNRSELGRAKNRRVEFKVLNKEALRREKTNQELLPR